MWKKIKWNFPFNQHISEFQTVFYIAFFLLLPNIFSSTYNHWFSCLLFSIRQAFFLPNIFFSYSRGGDIVHSKWEVVRHSSSQSNSLEQLNIFLPARQRLYRSYIYTAALKCTLYSCPNHATAAHVPSIQLLLTMLYSCASAHYTADTNHATAALMHTVHTADTNHIQLRKSTLYSCRKPCYSCASAHYRVSANQLEHTVQLPQTLLQLR